ncbi:hypothetical protein TorRG33x02_156760 [Trema orientale]|uniref:Uncharacterized protein n=1 Tax=Trema orientale TaxID=63057 RepID=A0A2P5EST6_TREOI|nr:hypothetical protein TorRG33x02_156760 [Trema orientale]
MHETKRSLRATSEKVIADSPLERYKQEVIAGLEESLFLEDWKFIKRTSGSSIPHLITKFTSMSLEFNAFKEKCKEKDVDDLMYTIWLHHRGFDFSIFWKDIMELARTFVANDGDEEDERLRTEEMITKLSGGQISG